MATYEYKCLDCGQKFEKVLTVAQHDVLKPPCPKCKSKHVEHCLSTFFAKTKSKN